MKIDGLVKTSLVDYPGRLCATLFLSGCSMRCPFCHNRALVLDETPDSERISEASLDSFLSRRRAMLEGICITGGEPTMQPDLEPLLRHIKSFGYSIKLDTNGLHPDRLKALLDQGLVDYVAMDIKNSPTRYGESCGLADSPALIETIERSINLLRDGVTAYEFRTTVARELHTREDLMEIGLWLKGSMRYALQSYVHRPSQLSPAPFTAFDSSELQAFSELLKPFFNEVILRC